MSPPICHACVCADSIRLSPSSSTHPVQRPGRVLTRLFSVTRDPYACCKHPIRLRVANIAPSEHCRDLNAVRAIASPPSVHQPNSSIHEPPRVRRCCTDHARQTHASQGLSRRCPCSRVIYVTAKSARILRTKSGAMLRRLNFGRRHLLDILYHHRSDLHDLTYTHYPDQ